ncbi:hypothetical protein JW898_06175 [Candidatus Woesearchaeota archaeon]|nr:hypothetical protein [Candidatus Woesearchaeota archaeon]
MGIVPEEKGWAGRHPVITTIIVIILIAAAGFGLRVLQQKYFPAETQEFTTPVFLNESYYDVDQYFDVNSNLTEKEQDELFDTKYKFNVVKWTCKPISCQELVGTPTLKLICNENGFTEDVRVAMKEDCSDSAENQEVTVVFQLISKTTGEYYLGRSGMVVEQ